MTRGYAPPVMTDAELRLTIDEAYLLINRCACACHGIHDRQAIWDLLGAANDSLYDAMTALPEAAISVEAQP